MKQKIIVLSISYILFILYFTILFLPDFYKATNGLPMIDSALLDFRMSTSEIGNLIYDYNESGRAYMVNFFFVDLLYIVISSLLFSTSINALTGSNRLSALPFFSGAFDFFENCIVLYASLTLDVKYLLFARIFAVIKGLILFTVLVIIVKGLVQKNKK